MVETLPTVRADPFCPPRDVTRGDRPLRRLAYPDGHLGWLVTGHALARAVLADSRFSARLELVHAPIRKPEVDGFTTGKPGPGYFQAMDPPEHTRFRHPLARHFTVRRVNQLAPRIERIVHDRLSAMEQAGSPADLVELFALPVPSLVICELLGVPYADRAEFQRNGSIMFSLDATSDDAATAYTAILDYLRELIHRKRMTPTDDLLSGLATSGELTDDEIAGVAMFLLIAGHETTANMLSLGTLALLRHPDQLDLLLQRRAAIDTAVEELLRYLSIIQFGTMRTALEDVQLGGEHIATGETVTISFAAANHDRTHFDHPGTLDLLRDASGHLAFSHGVHQCLGHQLARIEMRIGYDQLFRRFPSLRLAVPFDEIPFRNDMIVYGVDRLPVAW